MNYAFKWSVLWSGQSGAWLLQGLITTLELSAVAWLIAVALGILSGALRTVPFRPLRWLATFYVEFFRNVPLLTSNAVDLIAETMTDTPQRRETVDFSLTFFYTGAQFLVKKGSPIHGVNDIAGKRIASQQGSTNAKIIREKYPQAQLREFPDQPAAFQALAQGQVDAYTNDGIQLAGLKAKAPKPDEWEVVGDFYSEEPYGMAMRKGDARFKAAVDAGLKKGFESGKYFEIYDKWFGPKGELPYPMSAQVKAYLLKQIGE